MIEFAPSSGRSKAIESRSEIDGNDAVMERNLLSRRTTYAGHSLQNDSSSDDTKFKSKDEKDAKSSIFQTKVISTISL